MKRTYFSLSNDSNETSRQFPCSTDATQAIFAVVPFRDSLLPRREGAWNPGGKRESPEFLSCACSEWRHFPPPPPPQKKKLGEKPYLEKDFLFGHILFRVLLHWINGDNVKGNYNAKFLEAIDFAFKKCHFTFVLRRNNCKLFMQSLPVMMVLLNLKQDLASLFATWLFL